MNLVYEYLFGSTETKITAEFNCKDHPRKEHVFIAVWNTRQKSKINQGNNRIDTKTAYICTIKITNRVEKRNNYEENCTEVHGFLTFVEVDLHLELTLSVCKKQEQLWFLRRILETVKTATERNCKVQDHEWNAHRC